MGMDDIAKGNMDKVNIEKGNNTNVHVGISL